MNKGSEGGGRPRGKVLRIPKSCELAPQWWDGLHIILAGEQKKLARGGKTWGFHPIYKKNGS